VARLAAVGRAHVGANAGAALAGAALAVAPGRQAPSRPVRAAGLVAATAATAALGGVLGALDRRAGPRPAAPACGEPVAAVRVYVSEDCPACRSLATLLGSLEEARRSLVHSTVVRGKEDLPAALQGLGVPSAQALDGAGAPICAPVSGIGDVKALVDRLVIGGAAPAAGAGAPAPAPAAGDPVVHAR
jgi:hypothetical protein